MPGASAASFPVTGRGSFDIDGMQIPLPEGQWRIAGQAVAEPDRPASLALIRIDDDAVTGAVLVQIGGAGASSIWGKAPSCERTDLSFAQVRYASDHDVSCAWAGTILQSPGGMIDPAWTAALVEARRSRWSIPSAWLFAGIRVTDPLDAVQIRYAFAPSGRGAGAPDADWIETAWDRVEQGFRHRLEPGAPLPDWPVPREVEPARRAAPDSEAARPVFSRAVWKTITFRIIGTTLDFSANYVALGTVAAAAALSAFGFVIAPFVYLGHEMAWDYFTRPSAIDLPGLGVEER